jgi:hypothetical protein
VRNIFAASHTEHDWRCPDRQRRVKTKKKQQPSITSDPMQQTCKSDFPNHYFMQVAQPHLSTQIFQAPDNQQQVIMIRTFNMISASFNVTLFFK